LLTNKERNFLRSLGNELSPIVIIGKGGLTPNIIDQLEEALTARELVKCRVLPHTEYDPYEIAGALSEQTHSEVVQVVGRNMLIYRRPPVGKTSKLGWPTEA
jgi:RNA-binding protein